MIDYVTIVVFFATTHVADDLVLQNTIRDAGILEGSKKD